ncbi:hypothetical protein AB0D04_37405 [Streptomyces sp. NPDC048483]
MAEVPVLGRYDYENGRVAYSVSVRLGGTSASIRPHWWTPDLMRRTE